MLRMEGTVPEKLGGKRDRKAIYNIEEIKSRERKLCQTIQFIPFIAMPWKTSATHPSTIFRKRLNERVVSYTYSFIECNQPI